MQCACSMASSPTSAIIFGAGGAIGGAITKELVQSTRFDTVYAGMRRATDPVPEGAEAFVFDLSDEESIAAACAGLAAPPTMTMVATGRLHNAERGIMPEKTWRALDSATLSEMFAVNAIGPAIIAKHLLDCLPRDRRAIFAVLSARVGSIADNRLGGWHGYRASKAALNMLVRNFAIELARSHPLAIAVALHPGTVESRLSDPFLHRRTTKPAFSPGQAAKSLLAVMEGLTPNDSGGLFAWDGSRLPW